MSCSNSCLVRSHPSHIIDKLYALEHPEKVAEFDIANAKESSDIPGVWISRAWLKGASTCTLLRIFFINLNIISDWRLRQPKFHQSSSSPTPGDVSPDQAPWRSHTHCEHGNLSADGSERLSITAEAGSILRELFSEWQPFSSEEDICPSCISHAEDLDQMRALAINEKVRTELSTLGIT